MSSDLEALLQGMVRGRRRTRAETDQGQIDSNTVITPQARRVDTFTEAPAARVDMRGIAMLTASLERGSSQVRGALASETRRWAKNEVEEAKADYIASGATDLDEYQRYLEEEGRPGDISRVAQVGISQSVGMDEGFRAKTEWSDMISDGTAFGIDQDGNVVEFGKASARELERGQGQFFADHYKNSSIFGDEESRLAYSSVEAEYSQQMLQSAVAGQQKRAYEDSNEALTLAISKHGWDDPVTQERFEQTSDIFGMDRATDMAIVSGLTGMAIQAQEYPASITEDTGMDMVEDMRESGISLTQADELKILQEAEKVYRGSRAAAAQSDKDRLDGMRNHLAQLDPQELVGIDQAGELQLAQRFGTEVHQIRQARMDAIQITNNLSSQEAAVMAQSVKDAETPELVIERIDNMPITAVAQQFDPQAISFAFEAVKKQLPASKADLLQTAKDGAQIVRSTPGQFEEKYLGTDWTQVLTDPDVAPYESDLRRYIGGYSAANLETPEVQRLLEESPSIAAEVAQSNEDARRQTSHIDSVLQFAEQIEQSAPGLLASTFDFENTANPRFTAEIVNGYQSLPRQSDARKQYAEALTAVIARTENNGRDVTPLQNASKTIQASLEKENLAPLAGALYNPNTNNTGAGKWGAPPVGYEPEGTGRAARRDLITKAVRLSNVNSNVDSIAGGYKKIIRASDPDQVEGPYRGLDSAVLTLEGLAGYMDPDSSDMNILSGALRALKQSDM